MFTVPSREQLKFLRHLISYYDHDPVHDKPVDLTANEDYFEPQVTNYKMHLYIVIPSLLLHTGWLRCVC